MDTHLVSYPAFSETNRGLDYVDKASKQRKHIVSVLSKYKRHYCNVLIYTVTYTYTVPVSIMATDNHTELWRKYSVHSHYT